MMGTMALPARRSRQAADGRTLARLAALLADETRATMCLALLDGRAWTAGELASTAGVAPSTATAHLDRLVDGGLLVREKRGRHRYLRLADARAASLIEELGAHAAPGTRPTSLRTVSATSALAEARTCYDHLAGRLGVALRDSLCDKGFVDDTGGLSLTRSGLQWLDEIGVDVGRVTASRRPVLRGCLDWTERRQHLAGSAPAAMCDRFLVLGWVERTSRPRAVRVTPDGKRYLVDRFGMDEAAVGGPSR